MPRVRARHSGRPQPLLQTHPRERPRRHRNLQIRPLRHPPLFRLHRRRAVDGKRRHTAALRHSRMLRLHRGARQRHPPGACQARAAGAARFQARIPLHQPRGRRREDTRAQKTLLCRLPRQQNHHLSRLPQQRHRTVANHRHHRLRARRLRHHHHIHIHKRLRIARRRLQAQRMACRKPNHCTQRLRGEPLPLRAGIHQDRLRAGRLGRPAPVCRGIVPRLARRHTRNHRLRHAARRQGRAHTPPLSARLRVPAQRSVPGAAPFRLQDRLHRAHLHIARRHPAGAQRRPPQTQPVGILPRRAVHDTRLAGIQRSV